MKLYLIQHGEAKTKEEDSSRPLTDIGIGNVRRIASYAAKHLNVKPHQIIHSGAARAEQTAQIFMEHLKPAGGMKALEYLSPMDDPEIWAERVSDIKDDLMLVGHLPNIKRITSVLLCGNPDNAIVNFQNGGIVCLSREESGNWVICWVLLPDMID
ncbi:MAG: phosphohistidine phosphatase SixA [candidate division Zixibacteria bacterium HGW-Zixibacteria-1]|nr:MAG: phosphohistidine phosphatase SixA [candidate division Zixibacteria bacterium HGW-Zixibacteria-1]